MSGRRLSRANPPVLGQAVMTRNSGVPMSVNDVDAVALRALCEYQRKRLHGDAETRWLDFGALYDATGLLSWQDVGTPPYSHGIEYVMPGGVVFPVVELYLGDDRLGARYCALLENGTRIHMKLDAPRFRWRV